jgi:hypothetical protein
MADLNKWMSEDIGLPHEAADVDDFDEERFDSDSDSDRSMRSNDTREYRFD